MLAKVTTVPQVSVANDFQCTKRSDGARIHLEIWKNHKKHLDSLTVSPSPSLFSLSNEGSRAAP